MLRFGLPTVPADASVYALQVADRFYLFRVYCPSAAGLYAVALKLATVVFVAVRGFQYAWPPLAYSIESDEEAARLYSLVTTYYALATGVVVCGVALLGRWMVRLLAAPDFFGAYDALPWLALGWALYGLYLVFIVIAGPRARDVAQPSRGRRRAGGERRAARAARPRRAGGPRDRRRGDRAVRRLRGDARRHVPAHAGPVPRRLSNGAGWRSWWRSWPASRSPASCCCRPAGSPGSLLRAAWLALVPVLLLVTRFFPPHECEQARALLTDGRRRVAAFRARRRRGGGVRRGPAERSMSGCTPRRPRAGPRRARAAASR